MYKIQHFKSSNRNRILECIFRNAPISRTEIAALTGITPATTTLTVNALIEEGFILELGEESDGEISAGRKRILLDLCPDSVFAAGAEFNQKSLNICITNLKGKIQCSQLIPYSESLRLSITEIIIKTIKKLLSDRGISAEQLTGIGIAVPGHMDKEEQHFITNHSKWQHFNAPALFEAFSVPVVFENNVRCMALKEYLFQYEESPESFAFFHVGMGMFCANIINGDLYLGNSYISGEIGHTIVNPSGQRCECGKRGCLQTISSEQYILQNIRKLYELNVSPILNSLADTSDHLTMEHIAAAYAMGDEAVTAYMSNALRYLGITASNLSIILNSEKLFLHGQIFTFPEIRAELMDYINEQLSFVGNYPTRNITISPYSQFDGSVGGCALAILRCFLQVTFSEA